MGWEFDEAGSFGSKRAAEDYALRNNLDPRDYRISNKSNGVELEIRRSAIDAGSLRDNREGRRDGWT
jgi:hypothetical protein